MTGNSGLAAPCDPGVTAVSAARVGWTSLTEKVLARSEATPDGHLLWRGTADGRGRAIVHWGKRRHGVRFHLWQEMHGLLPRRLRLRRTCAEPLCVHPRHAEATPSRRPPGPSDLEERIVGRLLPTAGGCEVWTGGVNRDPFPRISVEGRSVPVARARWEHARGPVPAGQIVARRCGDPRCVALAHLHLLTPSEKHRRVTERGAFAGEAHWNHRLTDSDVRAIRASSRTEHELAALYEVSPRTIRSVRGRHSWTHI